MEVGRRHERQAASYGEALHGLPCPVPTAVPLGVPNSIWAESRIAMAPSFGCRYTRFASSRLVRGASLPPGPSSLPEAASGGGASSRAALGRRMSGNQDTFPRQAPCFGHRTASVLSVSFDRPRRVSFAGDGVGSCASYPIAVHGYVVVHVSVPLSPLRVLCVGWYRAGIALPGRSVAHPLGVPVRAGAAMPSACSRLR